MDDVTIKTVKTEQEALAQVYAALEDPDSQFVVGNDYGGYDLTEDDDDGKTQVIISFRVG